MLSKSGQITRIRIHLEFLKEMFTGPFLVCSHTAWRGVEFSATNPQPKALDPDPGMLSKFGQITRIRIHLKFLKEMFTGPFLVCSHTARRGVEFSALIPNQRLSDPEQIGSENDYWIRSYHKEPDPS